MATLAPHPDGGRAGPAVGPPDDDAPSPAGRLIKSLLLANGWSMRELGRRAGVSSGYISLLVKGGLKEPSARHAAAIAAVFGLSVEQLVRGDASAAARFRPSRRPMDPRVYHKVRRLMGELMDEVLRDEGFEPPSAASHG